MAFCRSCAVSRAPWEVKSAPDSGAKHEIRTWAESSKHQARPSDMSRDFLGPVIVSPLFLASTYTWGTRDFTANKWHSSLLSTSPKQLPYLEGEQVPFWSLFVFSISLPGLGLFLLLGSALLPGGLVYLSASETICDEGLFLVLFWFPINLKLILS